MHSILKCTKNQVELIYKNRHIERFHKMEFTPEWYIIKILKTKQKENVSFA